MSCFYASIYRRRFPVSLLAIERFYELQDQVPIEDAVLLVLNECCGLDNPVDEDAAYLLERLVELSKKTQEKEKEPTQTPPQKAKTRGSAYHEFISKLPTDRTILWMTGFDYAKARTLYCTVDRDDVMQMVEDFLSVNLEENRAVFEAALYGNGGSYADDTQNSQHEEGVVDLSNAGKDGLKSALREAFGM